MYLYHLQLLFLYFLSCFLAFSLFKFINGEGPGILGVFLDLTSEFTYLLNNDRSSKYIDHHFCQPTLYPCVVYLRYHQGCHCHSISSFPRAGCFQLLHSQNWRKEPKLPFKDLNLIFLCFSWTRRSAESSSSWTGWLYQGLGRILQENGYVLPFFFYTCNQIETFSKYYSRRLKILIKACLYHVFYLGFVFLVIFKIIRIIEQECIPKSLNFQMYQGHHK